MQPRRLRSRLEIVDSASGGQGGKEALVYITDEGAKTLRQYLDRRPLCILMGKTLCSISNMVRDWAGKIFTVCLFATKSWQESKRREGSMSSPEARQPFSETRM